MIPQRWSKYTFKEGSNLPLLAYSLRILSHAQPPYRFEGNERSQLPSFIQKGIL